jgi:hypothetical protein
VEHDYTSRVALLLDDPNRDTLALCTLAQAREQLQAFALA